MQRGEGPNRAVPGEDDFLLVDRVLTGRPEGWVCWERKAPLGLRFPARYEYHSVRRTFVCFKLRLDRFFDFVVAH